MMQIIIRYIFKAIILLLGCFVRLLYWSVRVYGWGRVFGFFVALTLSGWVNFSIIPSIIPGVGLLNAKIVLIGIPLGTLIFWGVGVAGLRGIRYAWQESLTYPRNRQTLPRAYSETAEVSLPATISTESGPLWEQVISWGNMLRAWQHVETNRGSAGPDGITLEAFSMDWENQLRRLIDELTTWRYRPQLPRWVEVSKQSGGMRRLAIFDVRDRIVQQLLNQILLPIWDSRFAECSYAYRPGRSAHQAVNAVEKNLQNGRPWVFDADIASFFDNVPHRQLLTLLESWLPDASVRSLLSLMLTSVSQDGLGLPQGSAISPLLSNLYLHSFDEVLLQRGYVVYRYADDFVILCPTRQQAENALQTSRRLLKALQLRLNDQKTRIIHIDDGFTFLGFTFTADGKRPSEQAVRSLNERLSNASDAQKRQRIETGWRAYFGEDVCVNGSADSQIDEFRNTPYHEVVPWVDNGEQGNPSWFGDRSISDPPDSIGGTILSDADWNTYCQRFVGRKELFAKYWQNEKGRCGYVPVRRAITKQDVEAHLSGRETLGIYLLEQDGRTKSLVFDVDGPTSDEAGRQKAHKLAMRMLEALDEQGISPLLFDSGGKGRHLWLCFTEPVPAKPIRQWAQFFLDKFRPFQDGVLVEVFPKQDFISGNALGSMLRLPLGRHPKTGRFASLLDHNGQKVTDLWHVLRTHPLINPSMLDSVKNSATSLEIPKPPEAVAPMVKGCALLRGLVEKAAREHNLKHTERLSLLYTLGHCGDAGRSYIHQLIALCSNYDPRITERFIQRLEPGHKAVRCSTLKEWLKDYLPDVSCECQFKKKNPSPLHLLSFSKKKESQSRNSSPPVSDQEWKMVAEDLFDFNEGKG